MNQPITPHFTVQLGAYLKDFHPGILGLTGTPDQIKAVAKAFRCYFSEVDRASMESEDYLGEFGCQRA
jgi:protein SCO1/2